MGTTSDHRAGPRVAARFRERAVCVRRLGVILPVKDFNSKRP